MILNFEMNSRLQRVFKDGGREDAIESFNGWSKDFFGEKPEPKLPKRKPRMTSEEFIEALEVAGLEPFTYGGRFMYGKKCPAVVWRNCPVVIGALIVDAVAVQNDSAEKREEVLHVLQSTKQDNMGLNDMVYYWPNIEWVGEVVERDDTESDRDCYE